MAYPIRVGIIGTSWWADWMHLPSLQSHPHAEFVAICGRNRANAEAMAQKYAIGQVFTDYHAMIAQGGLDALIVSTPDDSHYAITLEALDAGLHVLCEKPLALTLEQAWEIDERAEAAGLKHMVLYTYRWMPQYAYLRELVQQGYLGRCLHADFQFFMDYGRDGQYAWRFDRQRANGLLGDLGSHLIDMARWYFGEIASVSAELATCLDRPGLNGAPLDPANDAAFLTLTFAQGGQATLRASAVAYTIERSWKQCITLYGTEGSLEADIHLNGVVRGARSGEERPRLLPIPDQFWGAADRSDPFSVLFQHSTGTRLFVDAIVADRPVAPNFYDGWKAQEVIAAGLESHQCGCRVLLG